MLLGCSASASGGGDDGFDVPAFQGALNPAPNGLGSNGTGGTGIGVGGPDPNSSGAGSELPPPVGGLSAGGSNSSNNAGNNAGAANSSGGAAGGPPPNGEPVEGASAGCGLAQGIPANPGVPNTILTFPTGYDGNTPFPLVFAFHGAGRTNEEMRMVDSRTVGSDLEANYMVAFMKSAGNGWDIGADYGRFEAALEQISAERCIDNDRIFAFGHSSGAQFIVQLLGDNRTRETRFAGVIEVASSRFQNPAWSPLPTLVIHGLNDTQRGGDVDGASDIVQYTESNQCSANPPAPRNVPSCSSLADGVAVNAGCVEYQGCAAPTIFCNHNDPNYLDNGNPTNHGWPCFANGQIFQFLESVQ